jgi:transposase-like protein
VEDVSVERIAGIVRRLGITTLDRDNLSATAGILQQAMEGFRRRTLKNGPYRTLAVDVLVEWDHRNRPSRTVACVIATGLTARGECEILGFDVLATDRTDGWVGFFQSLLARGLSGVLVVAVEPHDFLRKAIRTALPGVTQATGRGSAHFEKLSSSMPWERSAAQETMAS